MRIQNAYNYTFVMRQKLITGASLHVDVYHFKSLKSNLWYIVRVECYPFHMYAIKFYPKKFELSPDKYRLLTNTFEPRTIVNTCINIMMDVYESDGRTSFMASPYYWPILSNKSPRFGRSKGRHIKVNNENCRYMMKKV